ncbi:tRNA sulfurtransferase [Halogeometricum borinquense]|uniref:Probable tRNA sulfurtransferase n=1 Tax=Halogeometricum borinquense TaxID=60847 RepID=A0A6C0UHD5_9EURY|nr:THUMP domain-containing protein [Halogeometricum borinquense]QIB74617.1 tRNA sulfurtransferase [Halogeometricum borinquense]QIQ76434.1 tRNA sulfurtransferase [Halogeometricum borinquense]
MTEADAVLVGYSEVGTKSSEVRTKMADRLAANVRALLRERDSDGDVERRWSRLVVHTARPHSVAEAVATLPGVAFARPVVVTEATIDAVRDVLQTLARDHESSETFAVDSRRVGPKDRHDFSSRELDIEGGRLIEEQTGATVDLDNPDRTYRIEVREDDAFVAAVSFDGPGGLPLGTQGRVAVLVSGGIDSPVAAWRLMRRGCVPIPVYVDLGEYGGADHRARAFEVIRTLATRAPGEDLRPRVVDGSDVVDRLIAEVSETRMLSLRRAMLVMAEAVARRDGAHSVATGEALGQKSSQTGANLAVTDEVATMPVHRPLLTTDKSDIVAEARRIGTYDDSTLPVGCERVAPSHPETNAAVEDVAAAEPGGLLDEARRAGENASVADVD